MSSPSRVKKSWDPVWDQVFISQEWGKYPPEHVIRFVARNWYKAPNRKAVRLLDLSCGPGAVFRLNLGERLFHGLLDCVEVARSPECSK